MPKPSDDIQKLKRSLTYLARLEGRALACAEGAVLLEPVRVRDPRPLVEACLAGRPPLAALRSALELAATPVSLTPRLLAAAQRDLRMLETSPGLVALTREAPRIFRRYGTIDAAWIERKRARLARLAEVMGAVEVTSSGSQPPWFLRVLDVIRFLYGDASCQSVEQGLARLIKDEEVHRRALHRMLDELLEGLEGGRAPRETPIAEALQALREAESLPGRSRTRKVAQVLAQLLDLPLPNEGHSLDRSLSLVPIVRTLGQEMLSRIPSPRSPAFQDEARRFFACFGLAFDPRPRDGGALPISRAIVKDSLRELGPLLKQFGGRKLTLAEVLVLSPLTHGKASSAITSLVEAGLPIEKVRKLTTLGRLGDLEKLPRDPATAEAYADWASTLVPHYAALGLDLPLAPDIFEKLRVPRREDLAVLAVCLMKHHTGASPEATELALARLDATLGLFQRRPAEAASIITELSGTSPGAGRAAFPEFAAWLGDDALLDRFVHLSRLAGTPVTLSQRLRTDFERDERRARQRDHLKELRTRSAAQAKRLARLEADAVPAAPGRTRRRLADRVRELTALAYERRLDAVFLRILKEVWGISLTRLEPGWRDAIRFYLAVDNNRELLGTLLRTAAAGGDVARTLPKNRAWLAKARLHLNVEAWLAPRSRDLSLSGKQYRIAVEQDPIEVLRMGIPFDTCLALEKGSNAASTIVNAVDANKRVIYLRDARGQIVARKLLAVSSEYTLLGYRLYIAESTHQEAIAQAFQEFCGELATAARLPFATSGKPQQIHPGFWYDDGVVAEDVVPSSGEAPVEAYCESLGLPPPRVVTELLRDEASIFEALRRGDEAAVFSTLRPRWRPSGVFARAAQWLLARIPPEHLVEKMRSYSLLATMAIRRAAEAGPVPMFELAGRAADSDAAQEAADLLFRFPRTAEAARAFVNAALASKRNAPRFDDHGLEHQTIYLLPAFAAELPVMASFALCDRVEPLWRWVAQEGAPHCANCAEQGEQTLIEAIVRHYASARDPACVIRQLERSRGSKLARRAALHIAARYALCEEATAPTLPWPRLEPLRSSASALRALSRLRKREPEWDAEPEMLAALLRQSGGGPLPHGTALPVPHKAPFDALGDLLLQLDLTSVVAHWPQPANDLARQRRVIESFACIDRHLAGEAEEPVAVATALKEVQQANLPWTTCQPIVQRLLMRREQGLTQAEESFIKGYLGEKTAYRHPELTPEMIVAAWQVKGLRGALAQALAKTQEDFFSLPLECIESAAQRMGGRHLVNGLFEAVVEALLDKGAYETLGGIWDETLFRRAIQFALSKGAGLPLEDGPDDGGVLSLRQAQAVASVASVVALYKAIPGHSYAAWFLKALSRSPLLGMTKEFERELGLARKDWQETYCMPLEWLEACIERSRPGRS